MDLKVGDLVRRYKFDCVEWPPAPLVGIIIKIESWKDIKLVL